MKRKSEPEWFTYKVRLKVANKNQRAKNRLYEHGAEFWLVETDGMDIHVYSLDKTWYGWFKLGVEVNYAKDQA